MKGVLENLQPIKRSGLPDDIAQAALWLASDDSTFVNGHALVVDGGLIGGRSWSESAAAQALRAARGARADGRVAHIPTSRRRLLCVPSRSVSP